MKKESVFLADRFGFTLVELLVVISIIGLLAGLAIPAINKAFDSASDTQDLNNLKQIGQGIAAHMVQYDGRIPNQNLYIEGAEDVNGNPRSHFREAIDRMFPRDNKYNPRSIYNWQRRSVWFSKRHSQNPPGTKPDSGALAWGSAWGINSNMYGPNVAGYISRAPYLSKLLLVGEINFNQQVFFQPNTNPIYARNEATQYRISRNGSAFYLFGDLHVEKIAGDQSTQAHPEYNKDNSTNRLYYKWW